METESKEKKKLRKNVHPKNRSKNPTRKQDENNKIDLTLKPKIVEQRRKLLEQIQKYTKDIRKFCFHGGVDDGENTTNSGTRTSISLNERKF